jgi:hypothetical protein
MRPIESEAQYLTTSFHRYKNKGPLQRTIIDTVPKKKIQTRKYCHTAKQLQTIHIRQYSQEDI